jgi:hypothetical protein
MNPRRRQGRDGESHPTSSRRFQLRGGGDLKRSLPEKYDTLRPYLVAVDVLIRMDAPTVKRRVGMMPPESGMRVGALISDLESVAKDFDALASFFEMAAARLTLV